MKKKKTIGRKIKSKCFCHPNPIWNLVLAARRLVNWPFHWAAGQIRATFKHWGVPAILHHHKAISVSLGLCVLFVSFFIQNWFNHPVWEASVETMRAAGVCPLWEAIAVAINIGKEEV